MKKILKGILIFVIVIVCMIFLAKIYRTFINYRAEKNAQKYIEATYPDFKIEDIDARYEWYPNWYVVTYSDARGEQRELKMDHTGRDVDIDNYIHDKSWEIVYDYTKSIEANLTEELTKKICRLNSMYVDMYVDAETERAIVLDKESVIGKPVSVSLIFNYGEYVSKEKFIDLILETVKIIDDMNYNVSYVEFMVQNAPDDRLDFTWDDSMYTMSREELIQKID